MRSNIDRLVSQRGYKIVLRPTAVQASVEEQQSAARLAEDHRRDLRSTDQQRRQRPRQSAPDTAPEYEYQGFPDDDFDGGDLEDFGQAPGYGRWQDNASRSYTDRIQRNEQDWQRAEESMLIKSIQSKPENAARRIRQHAEQKRAIEEGACSEHECQECQQPLQVDGTRPVEYWSLTGHIRVEVPIASCAACGQPWESCPPTYDSFGNTAKQPQSVFSNSLLYLYRLFTKRGVSASHFCDVLTEMQAQQELASGIPMTGVSLDDRTFLEAYNKWMPMQNKLEDPAQLGALNFLPGTFGDCPACAHVPVFDDKGMSATRVAAGHVLMQADAFIKRSMPQSVDIAMHSHEDRSLPGTEQVAPADEGLEPEARNLDAAAAQALQAAVAPADEGDEPEACDHDAAAAEPLQAAAREAADLDPTANYLRRPFGVTADGCQKVNHYVNCGQTMTKVIRPQLNKYFAECNTAALSHPIRAASQDEHSTCGVSLACAREVANKGGGVTDVKCLITCTCLHTVPSKGCFIAARTNEQFFFYDLLLGYLMPDRMPASIVELINASRGGAEDRELEGFFMDTCCQYSAHLRNLAGQGVLDNLECYVGWLHSKAGHDMACQLKFSALYAEDFGRAIGENAEQLHAFFKPQAKSLRYMALPHWQDAVEDALTLYARRKAHSFAPTLAQHARVVEAKVAALEKEQATTISDARQLGADLAIGEPLAISQPAAVFDDAMQYARLISELTAMTSMSTSNSQYFAALNGAMGRNLITRLQSPENHQKLLRQLERMERRLRIDERWTTDCPEFKEHFQRLCAAQVLHHQAEVDRELSLLALHRLERLNEGASSRVSRLQIKRINRGRKAVRGLMTNWEFWSKQNAPDSPLAAWTMEDVLRGTPPWRPAGAALESSGGAAIDALKMRLHRVSAELQRSLEELRYVPGEAANSLNLFRYQITKLSATMEALMQESSALAAGKVFLLRGMLQRLVVLEGKAQSEYATVRMRFSS